MSHFFDGIIEGSITYELIECIASSEEYVFSSYGEAPPTNRGLIVTIVQRRKIR